MKYILILLSLFGLMNCQKSQVRSSNESDPSSQTEQELSLIPKKETTDTSFLNIQYLYGKFDPATHPDFSIIPENMTDRDQTYYLRKDALEAFIKMQEHAQKDGIELLIISATRPFNHQKRIWEAKWFGQRTVSGMNLSKSIPDPIQRAKKILEYSSMPGTSRHHWGTDIDINALENSYFTSGKGLKEYNWLTENAPQYGYCQVYTKKGEQRPSGYNMEKWHWSYLPVAAALTNFAKEHTKNNQISGFAGDQTAEEIDILGNYILGIAPECK